MSFKFDQLKVFIQGKIVILVFTETKHNESFLTDQFVISGYSKPYTLDINSSGGGLIIYIREDISSNKLIFLNMLENIERIFVEIK